MKVAALNITLAFILHDFVSLCIIYRVFRVQNTAVIVISWVTDETNDRLRCLNCLRSLLSFAANLSTVELLPVLVAGSFRLSIDDVKQVVTNVASK